jgi:hypothetical protein
MSAGIKFRVRKQFRYGTVPVGYIPANFENCCYFKLTDFAKNYFSAKNGITLHRPAVSEIE